MWCFGAGEADVGVLGLAGGRVLRLGVGEVTPCSSSFASGEGSPKATRKPIRNA